MTNYNQIAHLNIIPAMQNFDRNTQSNEVMLYLWYTLLTRLTQKVYDFVSSLPVMGFDIDFDNENHQL